MTKVALCLSGKIGNTKGKSGNHKSDVRILMKGYEHYKRHIIDKNDVDIFIHSWDVELKKDIEMLYKPKKIIVEKQIKFKIPNYVKGVGKLNFIRHRRKQNHYSRWYSNKIVNKIRNEYEINNNFKYDFVMTTRFDLAFERDVIFENYSNKNFYAGRFSSLEDNKGNDLFQCGRGSIYEMLNRGEKIDHLNHNTYGYPKDNKGLIDLWFFSNSDDSTLFNNLYDHLNEYNKPDNCPYGVGGTRKTISSHQLSLYHLKKTNLIRKLKFDMYQFDDFPEVRKKYYGCRI